MGAGVFEHVVPDGPILGPIAAQVIVDATHGRRDVFDNLPRNGCSLLSGEVDQGRQKVTLEVGNHKLGIEACVHHRQEPRERCYALHNAPVLPWREVLHYPGQVIVKKLHVPHGTVFKGHGQDVVFHGERHINHVADLLCSARRDCRLHVCKVPGCRRPGVRLDGLQGKQFLET